MITKKIDPWFEENLVCPIDKSKLTINNNNFVCSTHQHKYEIYNNIPIMLVNEYIKSKNDFTIRSLKILKEKKYIDEYYNSNLKSDAIDDHVQNVVAATNSNFYKAAIGKLIGPMPAHLVTNAASKLRPAISENKRRICEIALEVAQEELRLTPTKVEFDNFSQEIQMLSSRVDRLEAHFNAARRSLKNDSI